MNKLPSGTVTFLFTDIEDSTRLWQEQPEAMPQAHALHDRILHEAIDANHGGPKLWPPGGRATVAGTIRRGRLVFLSFLAGGVPAYELESGFSQRPFPLVRLVRFPLWRFGPTASYRRQT